VITDPLPTGIPPSSVAPATDPMPRADRQSTEATPTANPPVSPEGIPGSPQSPIFESTDRTSSLQKSSTTRQVGDRHPFEGPDSPRMEYSFTAHKKFDRVDREPEPSKEVAPQVSRSNPRGNQGLLSRIFPGIHVDPALPSTLQENLRLTMTDRLIQVSTRGFYRANAHGEQPLTERTLVLIVMHEHITCRRELCDEGACCMGSGRGALEELIASRQAPPERGCSQGNSRSETSPR
jgi:hypothetical protein